MLFRGSRDESKLTIEKENMKTIALANSKEIYQRATPVLHIRGIGGKRWKRNVAKGGRIGPWLQAEYHGSRFKTWEARIPCLYLVGGAD